MNTEADKTICDVKTHVKLAVEKLAEVVSGKSEGHEQLTDAYTAKMRDAFNLLLRVKDLL